MIQALRAARHHDAKKLQRLANELTAKIAKYNELNTLDGTPEYSIGFIQRDMERLNNDFYYLRNEVLKLKLDIRFLKSKCNVELLKQKRALERTISTSDDYDNIDF
jgi:hypothetical protein